MHKSNNPIQKAMHSLYVTVHIETFIHTPNIQTTDFNKWNLEYNCMEKTFQLIMIIINLCN